MNIAFIGIGNVGSALADGLAKAGHTIVIAARDSKSKSVEKALQRNGSLRIATPSEAVRGAEVVFLATPYNAAAAALSGLNLEGKILVDCTNPVGPGVSHGLQSRVSGSEEIEKVVPGAKVVKAFTIVGYENFDNSVYPGYGDLKPLMLIAGDDAAAKEVVAALATELGWQAQDAGPLTSALHLEHFCLLWIKMARVYGKNSNFVWALLQR